MAAANPTARGKRIHLCEFEADNLAEGLNQFFESEVEVPRIWHGSKQTINTLISEEALLLAKYLKNERHSWIPRIVKRG
ncbi:MAG: hypothetical protein ABSF24_09065 [Candidatus Bathyarchaeia archaeon]|jgi:hypothetical protein